MPTKIKFTLFKKGKYEIVHRIYNKKRINQFCKKYQINNCVTMSLLDSFDNSKKRCRECKKYFEIVAWRQLCEKCFEKVVEKFKKPPERYEYKEYPNKKVNILKNKYSYSNYYNWFKNE